MNSKPKIQVELWAYNWMYRNRKTQIVVIPFWRVPLYWVFRPRVSQHWVLYSWPWAWRSLCLIGREGKSEVSADIKAHPPKPHSSPLRCPSSSPPVGKQDSTYCWKARALLRLFINQKKDNLFLQTVERPVVSRHPTGRYVPPGSITAGVPLLPEELTNMLTPQPEAKCGVY